VSGKCIEAKSLGVSLGLAKRETPGHAELGRVSMH
jgi:hypothetical protein